MRTLAYIEMPIRVGDLIALLNGEQALEMWLKINEDGALVVCDG